MIFFISPTISFNHHLICSFEGYWRPYGFACVEINNSIVTQGEPLNCIISISYSNPIPIIEDSMPLYVCIGCLWFTINRHLVCYVKVFTVISNWNSCKTLLHYIQKIVLISASLKIIDIVSNI